MSKVSVLRKENGELFKDKRGRCVFEKEGVYFAMSKDQMAQMSTLASEVISEIEAEEGRAEKEKAQNNN